MQFAAQHVHRQHQIAPTEQDLHWPDHALPAGRGRSLPGAGPSPAPQVALQRLIRWNRVAGVLAGLLADLVEEALQVGSLLAYFGQLCHWPGPVSIHFCRAASGLGVSTNRWISYGNGVNRGSEVQKKPARRPVCQLGIRS